MNALTAVQCPPGGDRAACRDHARRGIIYSVLARAAPGPAGAAALARHTSKYRPFMATPQEPVELVNFGESVNFPLLFGGGAVAVRCGHDGAPAAGQRVPQARRGWPAESARVRPAPGRGRSQLAGDRGGPGRDRGRGAAGHRGGQGRLAGVRHELRCGAGTGGAACCCAALAAGCWWPRTFSPSCPRWLAARSRPAQLLQGRVRHAAIGPPLAKRLSRGRRPGARGRSTRTRPRWCPGRRCGP